MKRLKKLWLCAILSSATSHNSFAHSGETHSEKPSPKMSSKSLDQIQATYEKKIKPIFKSSCFNCHSTQTKWPWYSELPFVSDLVRSDVEEGRKHLDMTQGFPFEGHGSPEEDLRSIKEVVQENEMPPLRYKIMHWGSFLTNEEEKTIIAWINQSLELLTQTQSEDQSDSDH